MVLKLLKILLLILGIATLGLTIYAHLQNDAYLRSTALSLLSVVLAAAYAFGVFRRKPAVKVPAAPLTRQVPKDNSAPQQRRPNPPPRPAPTVTAARLASRRA